MEFIGQITSVPTTDLEDARRRKLLNILLVGIGSITLLILLATTIANVAGLLTWDEGTALIYEGSLAALVGIMVIFAINRYWSGWLASLLFSLLMVAIVAVSDEPLQVVEGRSMFLFAIPILMGSVLLRPWASFVMAGLSSLVIAALAVITLRIFPPLPSMLGFFAVALVLINLVVDLTYGFLDPRIRYQ